MAIDTAGKSAAAFAAEVNTRLDQVEATLDFLGTPVVNQAAGTGSIVSSRFIDPWLEQGGSDEIEWITATPTILTAAREGDKLVVRLGVGQTVTDTIYSGVWRCERAGKIKSIIERFKALNDTGGLTGIDLEWTTAHHPFHGWEPASQDHAVRPAAGAVDVSLSILRSVPVLDHGQYEIRIRGEGNANNKWSWHPDMVTDDKEGRKFVQVVAGTREFVVAGPVRQRVIPKIRINDPVEGEVYWIDLYIEGGYYREGAAYPVEMHIPIRVSPTAPIIVPLNESIDHLPIEARTFMGYRTGRDVTVRRDMRHAKLVDAFEGPAFDPETGEAIVYLQPYNDRDYRGPQQHDEVAFKTDPIAYPEQLTTPGYLPTVGFGGDDLHAGDEGYLWLASRNQPCAGLPVDQDPQRTGGQHGIKAFSAAQVQFNGEGGILFNGFEEAELQFFNNGATTNAWWRMARRRWFGETRTRFDKPEKDDNENLNGQKRAMSCSTVLANSPRNTAFPNQAYGGPGAGQPYVRQTRTRRGTYNGERHIMASGRVADAEGNFWMLTFVDGECYDCIADPHPERVDLPEFLGFATILNTTAGGLSSNPHTADWLLPAEARMYWSAVWENAAERVVSDREPIADDWTPYQRGVQVLESFTDYINGRVAALPLEVPSDTVRRYFVRPVGGLFPHADVRMDAVAWATYDPTTYVLTINDAPLGESALTFRHADATGIDVAHTVEITGVEAPPVVYTFESQSVGPQPGNLEVPYGGVRVVDDGGTRAVDGTSGYAFARLASNTRKGRLRVTGRWTGGPTTEHFFGFVVAATFVAIQQDTVTGQTTARWASQSDGALRGGDTQLGNLTGKTVNFEVVADGTNARLFVWEQGSTRPTAPVLTFAEPAGLHDLGLVWVETARFPVTRIEMGTVA